MGKIPAWGRACRVGAGQGRGAGHTPNQGEGQKPSQEKGVQGEGPRRGEQPQVTPEGVGHVSRAGESPGDRNQKRGMEGREGLDQGPFLGLEGGRWEGQEMNVQGKD